MEITINHIQSESVSDELLQMAYQKKWFKLFVSKKLEGLEATLPEGLQVIRNCNRMMGSFGWCINLGSGANYFSGFFSNPGANKIFTDSKCVLAGSGGLASEVVETEGGYLVSGKWGKATGSYHATYFTCNAALPNGDIVSLAIQAKNVVIHKDWNLFAMKASSSFGFSTTNAFVPSDNVFVINTRNSDNSYSIHDLQFDCFAAFCMGSAIIGLAEGVAEKLENEKIKADAKVSVSKLNSCIQKHWDVLSALSNEVWGKLVDQNKTIPTELISDSVKVAGKELFTCVNQLYFDAGLLLADEQKIAHHQYKDFMLAIQHSIFK